MRKWRVVRSFGKGVKEEEAWRVEPEKGMTQKDALELMKELDSGVLEESAELVKIVEYALHLRQYGERAPGGNETWVAWDAMAESFLRAHT